MKIHKFSKYVCPIRIKWYKLSEGFCRTTTHMLRRLLLRRLIAGTELCHLRRKLLFLFLQLSQSVGQHAAGLTGGGGMARRGLGTWMVCQPSTGYWGFQGVLSRSQKTRGMWFWRGRHRASLVAWFSAASSRCLRSSVYRCAASSCRSNTSPPSPRLQRRGRRTVSGGGDIRTKQDGKQFITNQIENLGANVTIGNTCGLSRLGRRPLLRGPALAGCCMVLEFIANLTQNEPPCCT